MILEHYKYSAEYIQERSTNKFQPNHIYSIEIDSADTGGYIITADYDFTEDTDVSLQINISSEKSFNRYFKEVA